MKILTKKEWLKIQRELDHRKQIIETVNRLIPFELLEKQHVWTPSKTTLETIKNIIEGDNNVK